MTVAENIYLGREPTRLGCINYAARFDKAEALLKRLRFAINPRARVASLLDDLSGHASGDGTAKLYRVPWTHVTAENTDKYLGAH